MSKPKHDQKFRRGVALVFALASVLIVAVLILGLTTLTQQHFSLMRAHTDAAAAVNVAEAGLYYELNNMSRWEYGESVSIDNTLANAYSGPVPGADKDPNGGSVSVYVSADANGAVQWIPPDTFWINSSGVIPVGDPDVLTSKDKLFLNTTRTLRAFGQPIGVGGLYTVYGVRNLMLNGKNFTVNPPANLPAYVGSAGNINVTGGLSVAGTFTFLMEQTKGVQAGWNGQAPNWDWVNVPSNNFLPTVDQIGSRLVARKYSVATSDPLSFLSSPLNNDNSSYIKVRKRDASGNLLAPQSIKWTKSDGTPLPKDVIDQNLFDANDEDGKLFSIVFVGNPAVVNANAARKLYKGSDFYFTKIDLPKNTSKNNPCVLEIVNNVPSDATAQAPVRVWLGPRGSSSNSFRFIDGALIVHNQDSDPSSDQDAFMLYNGTDSTVTIGGPSKPFKATSYNAYVNNKPVEGWYGVLYAHNTDHTGLNIAGDLALKGAAVGGDLSIGGDVVASINHNRPVDPYMFVMFYSINSPGSTSWFETNRYSATRGAR